MLAGSTRVTDKLPRASANSSSMSLAPVREYRLAAELRRSCWYVIAALPLLGVVLFWVQGFTEGLVNERPSPVGSAIVCLVFLSTAIAMAWPLLWRLRVDAQGISRRRWFWWDHWSWLDIASGRIRKQHPIALVDPGRPWWRGKLSIGYLQGGDAKQVIDRINEHYRLPPPPVVPATLTIRYGFRRSATFDSKGIHHVASDKSRDYGWREARYVHIERVEPLRRDFVNLVIALPDQELELRLVTSEGGTWPSWQGAAAEEINEFLHRHVPRGKIDVIIAGQLPKRREEVERALQKITKTQREARLVLAVCLCALFAWLMWIAIGRGVLAALGVGVAMAVFYGALVAFMLMDRAPHKSIAPLKARLAELSKTQ
jgi:hypothetical protein